MIDHINSNADIILGSGSPRRKDLLAQLGLNFTIMTHPVEETYPEDLEVTEIAKYIAQKKAKAFDQPKERQIIITADTIVALKNQILGKPHNQDDACNMLRQLSGQTHQVLTGVCLRNHNHCSVFHGITNVTFEPLTDDFITAYVKEENPLDKAGAYGIQNRFGMMAVKHIEGSFYNVMGLPVHQLYKALLKIINI